MANINLNVSLVDLRAIFIGLSMHRDARLSEADNPYPGSVFENIPFESRDLYFKYLDGLIDRVKDAIDSYTQ